MSEDHRGETFPIGPEVKDVQYLEIVCSYDKFDLMNELRDGESKLKNLLDDLDDPHVYQVYDYDLRDGNGQPLVYPISVVSSTAIVQKSEVVEIFRSEDHPTSEPAEI